MTARVGRESGGGGFRKVPGSAKGTRVVGPGEPVTCASPHGESSQLTPHQRSQQPLGSQGMVVSRRETAGTPRGTRGAECLAAHSHEIKRVCLRGWRGAAEGEAREGTGQGARGARDTAEGVDWEVVGERKSPRPRVGPGRGGQQGRAGPRGAAQGRRGAGGCLRLDRLYLPWRRRPPLVCSLSLRVPPSQPPPHLGVRAGACHVCLLVLPRCRCLGGLKRRRRRRAGRGRGLGLGRRRFLGLSYCR